MENELQHYLKLIGKTKYSKLKCIPKYLAYCTTRLKDLGYRFEENGGILTICKK